MLDGCPSSVALLQSPCSRLRLLGKDGSVCQSVSGLSKSEAGAHAVSQPSVALSVFWLEPWYHTNWAIELPTVLFDYDSMHLHCLEYG